MSAEGDRRKRAGQIRRRLVRPIQETERLLQIDQRILDERKRQDAKWGQQNHDDLYWFAILAEEMGELAKALIDGGGDAVKELVETAAVAVQWLEAIDRRDVRQDGNS